MRLLVISHTPHYTDQGKISGWGSTVRELDQLAGLFDELVHLAPLHRERLPESSLAYNNERIRFVPVKSAGGNKLSDKLSILGRVPAWLAAMRREMRAADAIHIRCPAGISLVALTAQRLWGRGKPTWVKYAGNWQPTHQEALSYKIQRLWLHKNFHRGVVTVNGSWPDQPAHVFTFNNPSFSRAEWFEAGQAAVEKQFSQPLQLLFVGRVEQAKGIERVLEIASSLDQKGINFQLNIVGDGPARLVYEKAAMGMVDKVFFLGWKCPEEVRSYYRKAHVILLPSHASEGWPKVLSEAMSYGVVPLAAAISSIPGNLARAESGQAIPAEDIDAYVKAIISYTEDPSRWKLESQRGVTAAESYTYEYYLDAVHKLFTEALKVDLGI